MLLQCSHRLPTGVGLAQARPNKKLYGEVKDSKFHYINSSYIQDVEISIQENSTVITPPANPSASSAPSDHTN